MRYLNLFLYLETVFKIIPLLFLKAYVSYHLNWYLFRIAATEVRLGGNFSLNFINRNVFFKVCSNADHKNAKILFINKFSGHKHDQPPLLICSAVTKLTISTDILFN